MTRIAERAVLFADLRGSTSLFETLGNSRATALVTQSIGHVAGCVAEHRGTVVKTLGDGLMAVFEQPRDALSCALRMQEALAAGEVVELGGDCYGDAVNVAARLLDHAGDDEILFTQRIFDSLQDAEKPRFRRIDSIVLRGRVEPVSVYMLGGRRVQDGAATAFAEAPLRDEPDGVRLSWTHHERIFDSPAMPVLLGRSPQAAFCVQDSRVSRTHARLDWHGGSFQLTDLSSNGTYVRFADGEIVSLRRGNCTLHGQGHIGLGGSPIESTSAVVRFEVVRFGDTQP